MADARFDCHWATTDYLVVIYADCRRETSMPITVACSRPIHCSLVQYSLLLRFLSNGQLIRNDFFFISVDSHSIRLPIVSALLADSHRIWSHWFWSFQNCFSFLIGRIVPAGLPDVSQHHRRWRSSVFHLSTRIPSSSKKLPASLHFRYFIWGWS